MKPAPKQFFVAFLAMLAVLLALAPCDAAKKRVAVMPLEKLFVLSDSSQDEEIVAQIMSDQLVVAIQESGNYTVVERVQFDKAMQELGFQELYSDPDYAVEMGASYGAEYIVVGKITKVNTEAADKSTFFKRVASYFDTPYRTAIALELRMVNCQTSEVILAKTIEGERGGKDAKNSLYNACRQAATNFMREVQASIPFAGRVIGVKGSDIYIDQGLDSGLHKNETLLVAREGEPLESGGKIIGMTLDPIGKATVVEVTADYAICRMTEGAAAVQKGDIVKRSN